MRKIPLVLALTILSGCAPAWTVVRTDDAFRATGMERAGFDLGCPPREIKSTVLAKDTCNRRDDGVFVCNGDMLGAV